LESRLSSVLSDLSQGQDSELATASDSDAPVASDFPPSTSDTSPVNPPVDASENAGPDRDLTPLASNDTNSDTEERRQSGESPETEPATPEAPPEAAGPELGLDEEWWGDSFESAFG
jgi:hypothetical protein